MPDPVDIPVPEDDEETPTPAAAPNSADNHAGYEPVRPPGNTACPSGPYAVWLLELKSSQKSKKGRELNAKLFDNEEKAAFDIVDDEQ